jgi:hypothetical protein
MRSLSPLPHELKSLALDLMPTTMSTPAPSEADIFGRCGYLSYTTYPFLSLCSTTAAKSD